MRPDARILSAAEMLDRILAGAATEEVLTGWARGNRFAGSGDRAALRDLVFDALRCRGSYTALAGASTPTGRALMIGRAVAAEQPLAELFTGAPHAPAPLDAAETAALAAVDRAAQRAAAPRTDMPGWLLPALDAALGPECGAVLGLMRQRAPVWLRVNLARATRAQAQAALASDGIVTQPDKQVETALEVIENARKIRACTTYLAGLVELQDLSPQAAVAALPLTPGARVLDLCAGGGGKSLAIVARHRGPVLAHDALPARMADLPARAARAGAGVTILPPEHLAASGPFDLVLADVPCSGSGTWRRTPDAKWRLDPAGLADLLALQAAILDTAAALVAPGGTLAYMTCSLLAAENLGQIERFLGRAPGYRLAQARLFTPLGGGDGFFSAHLTREN